VLDLCCGSGDFSALLVGRGYTVTGLEGSAEMLRFARERAPGAIFLHCDARAFDLPSQFDAVLSTFDSLNHILDAGELERVFANTYRALRPGGLFVFDLNMEDAFRAYWHSTWGAVEDTCTGITRGSYDSERRIGRADITVFRLESNGFWTRSDASVEERCYETEEVLDALRRAGFASPEAREAFELGMTDLALGRRFFFATK
jgi:SAM-dependent methyltransferase